MSEGLFYDIMVDLDERPDGWNKELYDKLSFEYLIECAENDRVEEWNREYMAYLKSELERLFPQDKEYYLMNIEKLYDNRSGFVQPDFSGKDFIKVSLDGVNLSGAHLDGVNLSGAHLDEAKFYGSSLNGANFTMAHLEGATFQHASLERAQFIGSHLDGAIFLGAHLEKAGFYFAILSGETQFTENTIDMQTTFIGASLSSARIDPDIRTQLERNIRQTFWEKWYAKPKLYPDLGKIKNTLIVKFSHNTSPEKKDWETKPCWVDRIINAFVRLFWLISNYGSSTKRIIAVFFGWNLIWAFIYFCLLPYVPGTSTTVLNVSNFGAAILQTNLMMFSITDLATEGLDILPMLCVTIHIVIGYFILAALITRLGIMFQNLSP